MKSLEGKVAIITGSASGIGRESAFLFARSGAKVVVADINDQKGLELVEEIKSQGHEAIFIHADMSRLPEIENMVKTAADTYRRVDIFWHNAGIIGPGDLEHTTEEAYDKTMAIHLKGGVFGAKIAIPEIRKVGGGSILFTASINGLRPSLLSLTYSLAKAGLVMLTRALAVSLGKDNIRVNCICPGLVETPLWEEIVMRSELTGNREGLKELYLSITPMGRFINKNEIALTALFLCSEEASAITGVAIPVDGGYLAR